MTNSSDKTFGFEYEYQGRHFAFHVIAVSQEEAEARVASMVTSKCVGQLLESTTDSMPVFSTAKTRARAKGELAPAQETN
jgi:hypothetical protein